jgi:non-heme chloroperoxidase
LKYQKGDFPMRDKACRIAAAAALLACVLHAQNDFSPHTVRFIAVDDAVNGNVKLEVLDWGGAGRPLVLLAGLGDTAHVFDDFAPELSARYHVYGITRRGFGASSIPAAGYEADRLGDDVLAVLDALKLVRPTLVGHSLAGEELSSVGSRRPDRVAGLVYLEAGYQYAFDDGKGTTADEREKMVVLKPPPAVAADRASLAAYQIRNKKINGVTVPDADIRQMIDITPDGHVGKSRTPPAVFAAIQAGMQKYTDIRVPALAIFAMPHELGPWFLTNDDPAVRTAAEAFLVQDAALVEKQAKAFASGIPSAKVVRLPGANHYVFISNKAEVLREINAFLRSLPSR